MSIPKLHSRLLRLQKIQSKGDLGAMEEINAVEDSLEATKGELEEKIENSIPKFLTEHPIPIEILGVEKIHLQGKKGEVGEAGKDGETPNKKEIIQEVIREVLPLIRVPKDGADGKDGYTPVKNVDYFDGIDGKDGKSIVGPKGEPGKDANVDELKAEIETLKEEMNNLKSKQPVRNFFGAMRSRFIDDETPTGTINGSNTVFTLQKFPLDSSLKVYRGGARQRVTEDYTFSGKTITFTIAPEVGEIILVDYRY